VGASLTIVSRSTVCLCVCVCYLCLFFGGVERFCIRYRAGETCTPG
jgi:hypothetical protein